CDAVPRTLDELEILDRPVRLDAADEAVVVLRRRVAVDVRNEINVLDRVVQPGLRREESLHDRDFRGARGWRRSGLDHGRRNGRLPGDCLGVWERRRRVRAPGTPRHPLAGRGRENGAEQCQSHQHWPSSVHAVTTPWPPPAPFFAPRSPCAPPPAAPPDTRETSRGTSPARASASAAWSRSGRAPPPGRAPSPS